MHENEQLDKSQGFFCFRVEEVKGHKVARVYTLQSTDPWGFRKGKEIDLPRENVPTTPLNHAQYCAV
jgi:hypothetical protein